MLAYQTLTKKKMYNNWMTHGDPNGTQAAKAMGLAIPMWMFEEEWRPYLASFTLVSVTALSLYLYMLSQGIMYNCANGISINSKDEMHNMIVCILNDNDGDQRARGLAANDWIDVFEVSMEAMTLNDLWAKKSESFADTVKAMLLDPKKKLKANEEAGGGCCEGGDESPQMKVLALIPRLNEVIFADIMKDMGNDNRLENVKYNRE